jgi:hypothetical protein
MMMTRNVRQQMERRDNLMRNAIFGFWILMVVVFVAMMFTTYQYNAEFLEQCAMDGFSLTECKHMLHQHVDDFDD